MDETGSSLVMRMNVAEAADAHVTVYITNFTY